MPFTPPSASSPAWADPGRVLCAIVGLLLLGFALTVDFPKAAFGFQSDESTYYSLAHSLAKDGDFAYEKRDLVRVWEEFQTGPEGIFLKKGKTISLRSLRVDASFPFIAWETAPDPNSDRLYFGKSFIYPLVAAPLVAIFGTNGFLVLHALLLTLDLAAAYYFLRARSTPFAAATYALVFFLASAAPVYFVWLTPEIFNMSVMLYGFFLWSYKEVAEPLGPERAHSRWGRFLRSPTSDLVAAALLGVATFSKPTNLPAIGALGLLFAWRRQWWRGVVIGSTFAAVVTGLFLMNAAITGEINYQGGTRNTFYFRGGFPFQRDDVTFEKAGAGLSRATDEILEDVLFTRDALLRVFPRNLVYFTLGRHTGLVPYFFPGVLSALLFLMARGRREPFQWCVAAGLVVGALALLIYMPFTYSGGGGPVGNRYFLGFYPLFLFLTPTLATPASAIVATLIGGLFTARLVFNPFYTSFHPAAHPKSGPFRMLPVELSLVNDLPMNVQTSRVKQPLGGDPPLLAYFLDDNVYDREAENRYWIRGRSRADLILRSPARLRPDGGYDSLKVRRVNIELRAGPVATEVDIKSRAQSVHVSIAAGATKWATVTLGDGLPYRPVPGQPTNYVYLLSIASSGGFVPLFYNLGGDPRYLGIMVQIVPTYEP